MAGLRAFGCVCGVGVLAIAVGTGGALGQVTFAEVTSEAGITFVHEPNEGSNDRNHAGVAAVDLTGDGFPELFFNDGYDGANHLYVNNADGTFTEAGAAWGVRTPEFTVAPVFFDYDGDGLLDLALASRVRTADQGVRLLRNVGGSFEDVTVAAGLTERFGGNDGVRLRGVTAFDYDSDGRLDLFASVVSPCDDSSNTGVMYRNRGDGTFERVEPCSFESESCHQWQPRASDIDLDGLTDLVCAEDAGAWTRLLMNTGSGLLVDVGTSVADFGDASDMGLAIGDYDNDGDFDIYTTDIGLFGNDANRLFRNEIMQTGRVGFTQVAGEAGVGYSGIGWGASFIDYDNDGWLDLVVASGNEESKLFRSRADGTFEDAGVGAGFVPVLKAHGIIGVDYDLDGDLDIAVANIEGPAELYRNDGGNDGNWLKVALRDRTGRDPFAVGAKISVMTPGAEQLREIETGESFNSQEPFVEHVGLGAYPIADQVRVEWPDGTVTRTAGVGANRVLRLVRSIADRDLNGEVNIIDFIAYLDAWADRDPSADLNGDGIVNTLDFIAYLDAFANDRL